MWGMSFYSFVPTFLTFLRIAVQSFNLHMIFYIERINTSTVFVQTVVVLHTE